MEAGTLRKLLTIESPVPAQDNYGQDVPGYVFVATVWGGIKTLSGRQLALAQANTITATSTHQIRIRLSTSPTPPRYFAIDAIDDPDERHRELVLTATEVKA